MHYIITGKGTILVNIKGTQYTVGTNHPRYTFIRKGLEDKYLGEQKLIDQIIFEDSLNQAIQSGGNKNELLNHEDLDKGLSPTDIIVMGALNKL